MAKLPTDGTENDVSVSPFEDRGALSLSSSPGTICNHLRVAWG
jgi:hypothetical protein